MNLLAGPDIEDFDNLRLRRMREQSAIGRNHSGVDLRDARKPFACWTIKEMNRVVADKEETISRR